jgi:hypothetical protein
MSENKEAGKLYWAPDAKIVLTGKEFEAFARLTELIEYPLAHLSTKELLMFFGPATEAARVVLERMKAEGVTSTTPKEEVAE